MSKVGSDSELTFRVDDVCIVRVIVYLVLWVLSWIAGNENY